MNPIRRCVHLDFHTSPDIPDIGSNFDKKQFQDALKIAHLESITVFAKCHHGVCYYPTKIGTVHPNLNFDLLGQMIDAAHEIGVKAPVYITAGWSESDANEHPEWCAVLQNGKYALDNGYDPACSPDVQRPQAAWRSMCLNDGEYARRIYALTEEICQRYKALDGLFYDILNSNAEVCFCDECKKGMQEMGLNPESIDDARKYYIIKHGAFQQKCVNILHKYHPEATIFFNSGGAAIDKPWNHKYQSHFEMEDLPTAWGGYNKMPLRAKYFSKTGKNYIGMTGKFHLDWGEFGGFKTKEALRAEACTMALYGAGCSVGDHLHPDGEMDAQTYKNIGYAFEYLEKIEPFCYNGSSTARLGIFLADAYDFNQGLIHILLENQIDFDVIEDGRLEAYECIVVPGRSSEANKYTAEINKFVADGGKLIFMYDAFVDNGKFTVDCGADFISDSEFDCDYIVNSSLSGEELPLTPTLCYLPGKKICAKDGEVLAYIEVPYFNRTYRHFCGHRNTPFDKNAEKRPAIVRKGNVVYFAHQMGKQYLNYGAIIHKHFVSAVLKMLYVNPAFDVKMPSQGRAAMIKQENRYCINLVYVAPLKRGNYEIIDEIVPLYNVEITVNVKEKIKNVFSGVTGEKYNFTYEGNKLKTVLPKLSLHDSIVLEF